MRPSADRDSWGIPKGHIQEGELVEECAKREVREEAGVDVQLEDRLTVVYMYRSWERKKLYAFLASVTGGDISQHDVENVAVEWFDIDKLPQVHVYQRPLIAEAQKILLGRADRLVPDEVIDAVKSVHAYAGSVNSWITLKKEVLKVLPPALRTLFSTRDPYTKKQRINLFEQRVARLWTDLTGRDVVFSNDEKV